MNVPDFKSYKSGTLKGHWLATRKLDGVCVLLDSANKSAMSKHGKPLYNFEYIFELFPSMHGIIEVYDTDWNTSVSLCRNQKAGIKVQWHHLYPTCPPHQCLHIKHLMHPSEELIWEMMKDEVANGNEGLVLWPLDAEGHIDPTRKPVKVKPEITVDIRVTDLVEGKGKYKNMLGAFVTKYGKVSGMADILRAEVWCDQKHYINIIIEVAAMGWTKAGKLRHPRFKRIRWDKDTENLEQGE